MASAPGVTGPQDRRRRLHGDGQARLRWMVTGFAARGPDGRRHGWRAAARWSCGRHPIHPGHLPGRPPWSPVDVIAYPVPRIGVPEGVMCAAG